MYIRSKLGYKKNVYIYLICLIPLVLYGIYKNGYLLYQKGLIDIWEVFKPLYLVIIGFIIYELISSLFRKKISFDNDLISCIISCMIVSPIIKISYFIIGIVFVLLINEIIKDKVTYNKIAFNKLIIVLICFLLSNYGYYNLLEQNFSYSFNFFDYIFGREVGGIAITSIFTMIIIYFILAFSAVYKKSIGLVSFSVYLFGCIIYSLLIDKIEITTIFNANVIFAMFFVATESKSSPYTFKKCIIYGIIIGMLTLIFTRLINVYEGVYIAILISSIIFGLLNKNKKIGNFS